jgi:hypothetical protein
MGHEKNQEGKNTPAVLAINNVPVIKRKTPVNTLLLPLPDFLLRFKGRWSIASSVIVFNFRQSKHLLDSKATIKRREDIVLRRTAE